MHVAIIDYYLNQITVFEAPDGTDVESLPGYNYAWCNYMTSDEPIDIRTGKQSDFPEFNAKIIND